MPSFDLDKHQLLQDRIEDNNIYFISANANVPSDYLKTLRFEKKGSALLPDYSKLFRL